MEADGDRRSVKSSEERFHTRADGAEFKRTFFFKKKDKCNYDCSFLCNNSNRSEEGSSRAEGVGKSKSLHHYTHAWIRLARSLGEGLVPGAAMGLWPPEIIPDILKKEKEHLLHRIKGN